MCSSYQAGDLLGVAQSILTVSGDMDAAGTSVNVTVNGIVVGAAVIDDSGSGTLIVPTLSLLTGVAEGSTIDLGTLGGTFVTTNLLGDAPGGVGPRGRPV